MKNILFCHDTYYSQCPDGTIYAYGAFSYSLWKTRFLPFFNTISVIGRKKAFVDEALSLDISSGEFVTHHLLPNINTPIKRLTQGRMLYATIREHVAKADGVIIRGPTEFGMMAAKAARELGVPYAVEMSGCAFDHSWFHGSMIGKLYAPIKYLRARHMVLYANQVIYVTERFLQKRYPTQGHTEFASNVEISAPQPCVIKRRLDRIKKRQDREPTVIGLIGNYGNTLKGLDIAFNALAYIRRNRINASLKILGSGNQERWQRQIQKLSLQEHIEFSGTLQGGDAVMNWLDKLDIYIQPSRHEGLPRAVIESMSRGLPVLASNAGGTAELLQKECIHNVNDQIAFNSQLLSIIQDTSAQIKNAQYNFTRAQDYTRAVLQPKRNAFWQTFTRLK